jgi:hypothetical protein
METVARVMSSVVIFMWYRASVPSQCMSLSTLWIRNSSGSGLAASAWSAWPARSTPVPVTARLVLWPRTAGFRASSRR